MSRCLVIRAACLSSALIAQNALAAPTELFFSEYVEGSSFNKAVEIYNGTSAPIVLDGVYSILTYFNGASTTTREAQLTGTIEPGEAFVLADSQSSQAILDIANQTDGTNWFNGDDTLVLTKNGAIIDVIGQIGFDPGSQWGSGDASTQDNTLRRKGSVMMGDLNAGDVFDPAVEWDGLPNNTFDGLGSHSLDGGVDPGPDPEPEPEPSACGQEFTPIPAIQGSGAEVAISGVVTTEGVVVGDFEGPSPALRGFYLQDSDGDGDPGTSDGIFVIDFNNADNVQLGQRVRVTGSAGEFQGQSQISGFNLYIQVCADGQSIEPTEVTLPFASSDFAERFEGMLVRLPQALYVTEHFQLGRFGQVVVSSGDRLYQPTQVAAPGADANAAQAANDLNRIIIDDDVNGQNPEPILLGRNGQPLAPDNTLRGGDTATGIVGVMTFTWAGNSASGNAWRVRPFSALGGRVNFEASNPRPQTSPDVGGTFRVASFNVLNYFNTFSGCSFGLGGAPADCRGADDDVEFSRQADKIVNAILKLDADVIGLMEIENDGYGPDSAIADLVNRLNSASALGTYAFSDVDAVTGELNALGTDAIKVAMIYRPAAVTPEGIAALNTGAFGIFETTGGNFGRNRPALAQTFSDANGGRFTAVVNHLKSKGSGCEGNISPVGPDADQGDGQGNCSLTRTVAAQELAAWLATDPTGTGGDPDVLVIGDLNAYAKEDPIAALEAAGHVNLFETDPLAYGYVFDGQWGTLDHALSSETLLPQVTGAADWHVNSDEPNVLDYNTNFKSANQVVGLYSPDEFRNSDHDPLVVGLDLDGTAPVLKLAAKTREFRKGKQRIVKVKVFARAKDELDPAPEVRLADVQTLRGSEFKVIDDFQILLERGRRDVLVLTYEARDFAGNVSSEKVHVRVPQQGKKHDHKKDQKKDKGHNKHGHR